MKLTIKQVSKIIEKLHDSNFEIVDINSSLFDAEIIDEDYFYEKINEALEDEEVQE